MRTLTTHRGHYDKTLLFAVLALIAVSVVMVYSSSSVVALRAYEDPAFFMKRQLLWALVGLGVMAAAMRMDHRLLDDQRVVVTLLVLALVLLVATLVPGIGREVNGSRRWLRLGMLSFQPSEFAKLALVIYLSYVIAKKGPKIRDFMNGMVPAYVVTGVFLLLAIRQPDFGAAVTLAMIACILLFAGGANVLHLAGTALVALPAVYFAVAHKAYRLRRIVAFLDPWSDPQGAGHQIIQSFLAFGSGGVFGRGLGEGRQKLLFLPERHSDFIYAVIGEELGLIGALIVLLFFLLILWRGVRIAISSGDLFTRLLALGITLLICFQGMINMAVVTGLVPTKGIALPLVSYGGSSLVITMAALGVLLSMSRETA
ncbi:MAG: cell division protein FtsW [Nitrospirae bacterium GWD2_57_9]|nr:MAG: cell division protein FtsW [Nitrospirae bacterium GWD2_57_9]